MATDVLPPRLALSETDRRVSPDEQKLLDKLDDFYDEGKRCRDEWAPPKDLERDLELFRTGGGPEKKHFAANFIEAFVDRMVAQLTDNRPITRIEARKAGIRGVSRTLDTVSRAVWDDASMQRQACKMAHLAATMRSAGLYTGYDPVLDEVNLEPLRIDQVAFDPRVQEAARVGRSADYLFIRRVVPTAELAARFPGRGAAVTPDARLSNLRVEDDKGVGTRTVRTPLGNVFSSQPEKLALPRAEVYECYLRDWQRTPDGLAMFPNGRLILRSKDLILWDGPNFFWDGDWPVDWYDWMVDPEHPWGRNEPSRLRHLQLPFNRLMDGLVRNQLISNIMTLIADWDAFPPEMWKKLQAIEDTLILRKQNRTATADLKPPPAFGADKLNIARQIFTFAQLLTGVTDVTLGETPGSLQSGQAIEGLQEGANLMTRSRASRLEDLYERVGQKLVSRIFQFFTADRVVALVGPGEDAEAYAKHRQEFFFEMVNGKPEATTPEKRKQAFRDFRFAVSPGSSAPGTRLNRGKMMAELFSLGLATGKDVLAAADIPEPDEMIARAQAERAKLAAAGILPPPPPRRNR